MTGALIVALGPRRYRVERPWGRLPPLSGIVSDVACDAAGTVFVGIRRDSCVDAPGPTVLALDAQGTVRAAWGEELADLHMLQTAPDGRVFAIDRDAHQVVIYTGTGERLGALGTRHGPGAPFNHPSDVAFGPAGEIYVAGGYGAGAIHVFGPDLASRGSFGAGVGGGPGEFSTPHAVWALADGRVAVADRENDRVQVFAPDGRFLAAWSGHYRPMDIATDADGNLLISDQVPRLTLRAPDGTVLGLCRPVLNGAHGVAVAPDGVIYLAELNPSRITRLVPLP